MGNRFASINVFFIMVFLQLGFVISVQAIEEKSVTNPANKTVISKKAQTLTTSESKDQSSKRQIVDKSAAAHGPTARNKIWNSAEMREARDWINDYFSVTRKYTPEQKAEYKKHLASLTAPQMQMWLMRFEHDRLDAKKRQAGFQTARDAQLSRDQAAIKQNQKSLRDIEKGENTAAADEEKRLKSEQNFARSMYRQKQRESSRMLEEYSSGGFGWGGGMGMGMR